MRLKGAALHNRQTRCTTKAKGGCLEFRGAEDAGAADRTRVVNERILLLVDEALEFRIFLLFNDLVEGFNLLLEVSRVDAAGLR